MVGELCPTQAETSVELLLLFVDFVASCGAESVALYGDFPLRTRRSEVRVPPARHSNPAKSIN